MNINLIRTEQDYNSALERLEIIFDAKKGTAESDELELLGMLVDQYENEKYPISLPDPIEAIKFRMEQMGMNQTEFGKIIGYNSRASEILNKKRKLSLQMIRTLHNRLKIPTDVLIQTY